MMEVAPLVWLLGFVIVVGLIWGLLTLFGVPIHPRLEQLAIALVILIVVVVIVCWLLGLIGYPYPFWEPVRRR